MATVPRHLAAADIAEELEVNENKYGINFAEEEESGSDHESIAREEDDIVEDGRWLYTCHCFKGIQIKRLSSMEGTCSPN